MDIRFTQQTEHEGRHYGAGYVLKDCPKDQATALIAAGKAEGVTGKSPAAKDKKQGAQGLGLMGSPFDRLEARLNAEVIKRFAVQAWLVSPSGARHSVPVDWRQKPILVENGQGVVSSYQAVVGIDIHAWPTDRAMPDTSWTVEIAGAGANDSRAGTWEIADLSRPSAGWLDLHLTNRVVE